MVRLHTLGALDLRNAEGSELRAIVAQPKRLALLVYLAVATPHGFHRRDSLLPLFWRERDLDQARASLSRALYFLRRELGQGVIESRGNEEVGLDRERIWCDAAAFDDAVREKEYQDALDLYRGPLLPGFFTSDAPGFEEWLEIQRARLRESASAAAWNLADTEEARGNFAAAAKWAGRGVELAPFHEAGFRRFLTLLDRIGDRAGAVHAYAKFSADIGRELDMSPSPETRLLIDMIKSRVSDIPHLGQSRPESENTKAAGRAVGDPRVAAVSDETSSVPRQATLDNSRSAVPLGSKLIPRPVFVGIAGITAAAVVSAVFVSTRKESQAALRTDAPPGAEAVAEVEATAWANHTGDPAFDRFGVNAAEQIVAAVQKTAVAKQCRIIKGSPSAEATMLIAGEFDRADNKLRFRVSITDLRHRRKPWSLSPILVPVESPEQAIDSARSRVIGAVAALQHPTFGPLFPAATPPPKFEAYQEFLEGTTLQSQERIVDALSRYRWAVGIDSSFTWSLLHAAMVTLHWYRADVRVHTDSLVSSLRLVHNRLTPLQRSLLDYVAATRVEDWLGAYHAMRSAAEIAPDQYAFTFADKANGVNHPREAVSALMRPRMDSIYRRSVQGYWRRLAHALHALGEHQLELAQARRARAIEPKSAIALVQQLRALAALGRVAEVRAGLDTLVSLAKDGWLTPGYALTWVATDLRAHGHRGEAAATFQRAIAWYRSRPPLEQAGQEWREWFADLLYNAGNYAAADTAYRSLMRQFPTSFGYPDNAQYLGHIGAIAARLGDSVTARTMFDRLVATDRFQSLPGQESRVFRARIAALRGDRAEAMRLLASAYGPDGTMDLHEEIDFDGMKDYPPFQEFVRPKG